MASMQDSPEIVLDPVAQGAPEVLAILLHDKCLSAETARAVAVRWAKAVPTTAFLIVESPATVPDGADDAAALDRVARLLLPVIGRHLRAFRLGLNRLVLIGCGEGGTLALHFGLRDGFWQAGVLAIAPRLNSDLARTGRTSGKIRIIAYTEDREPGDSTLGEFMGFLIGRSIDVRGAVMTELAERNVVLRLGGSYLAELVATAQHGGRYGTAPHHHFDQ